jgi:hypothetical protein
MPDEPEVMEAPSLPISTNQGLFLTSIVGACSWYGAATVALSNQGTVALAALFTVVPILAIIFRLLGDEDA